MSARAWRRFDDGRSRQFEDGTTARHVAAKALAQADGWAEIRPTHWSEAGAVVKALRESGHLPRNGRRIT